MLRALILTCENPVLENSPAQDSGFIVRSEQIHRPCQRCLPNLGGKTIQRTTEAPRFMER